MVLLAGFAIWLVYANDSNKEKNGVIDLSTIGKKSGELDISSSQRFLNVSEGNWIKPKA